MTTTYQERGTSFSSMMNVARYLEANPGATAGEVMSGTKLSAPTVRPLLQRMANQDTSWPRRWFLKDEYQGFRERNDMIAVALVERTSKPGELSPEALREVWPTWVRMHMTWGPAMEQLASETNPIKIARSLETIARVSGKLATGLRQVQNEPDWMERIGGGPQ